MMLPAIPLLVLLAAAAAYLGWQLARSRVEIAALRAAAQAQEQARAQLVAAIEVMPEGLVVIDGEGRLVLGNSQYRSFYPDNADLVVPGARFEDILRESARRGVHVAAAGRVEEWVAERMARHRLPSSEFEQRLTDGRWVRVQERRLADGSSIGLRIDITELKRAHEQLSLSEERFRDFARTTSDWFWEQDAELRFTHFSDTSARPGRRFSHLIGKTREAALEGAGVPAGQWAAHLADLAARRPFRDFRYQRIGPNGDMRDISIAGTPIFDLAGSFKGYRGTGKDITEQVQAEGALRQAKEEAEAANRTKSQFLANMSHELRTPLNAVIGFSEVIRDGVMGPIAPRYSEYAGDIHKAGQHLLSLIADVLDLSKIEAGRLELNDELVGVPEIAESCRLLVVERARERGVRLDLAIPADLPGITADRLRLKQILLNLLSNAVKFTPSGGTVRLAVGLAADGGVELVVSDTGIGMRPEDIPIALSPFRQVDDALSRRYEGTGLGLPLAKNLAELHGGRLDIDSAPGRGTTVRVHLPATRVHRQAA